jgi:enoyl-CoA hydratase/carnithine racemase
VSDNTRELPGGLLLSQRGEVAYLTLNRPESRNAQTPATWLALATLPDLLTHDVRLLVVRGAGGHFSAGLDQSTFTDQGPHGVPALLALSDADLDAQIAAFQAGFHIFRDPRWISIAIVEGYAIGAGFQLALACDLRLADSSAKFAMKESTLGLVPDLTGTKPLVEYVGYPRALEWCVSGRMVAAGEALRAGLVHEVGDVDALLDRHNSQILAVDAETQKATKELLQKAAAQTLLEQCAAERAAQVVRFRNLAKGG